jgi:hypothetical protein
MIGCGQCGHEVDIADCGGYGRYVSWLCPRCCHENLDRELIAGEDF